MLEGVRGGPVGHVGDVEELPFGREVEEVLDDACGGAEICATW